MNTIFNNIRFIQWKFQTNNKRLFPFTFDMKCMIHGKENIAKARCIGEFTAYGGKYDLTCQGCFVRYTSCVFYIWGIIRNGSFAFTKCKTRNNFIFIFVIITGAFCIILK